MITGIRRELADLALWRTRAAVVAAAAAAGLTVVLFCHLCEWGFAQFTALSTRWPWAPLLWTPLCTGAVAWGTLRFAPGAAGSGIPQVMAALESDLPPGQRGQFVSLRLALAKLVLTAGGLLGGLSLGREGPSVQIAAGILLQARRVLPARSTVSDHGLLIAGGAAGIAAAFNTPLGGVMFAIEELARRPEQRNSGLLIAAIVLAGLIGVSVNGNGTYFGVIPVQALTLSLVLPGVLVVVLCGLVGGAFARLIFLSLRGGHDAASRLRQRRPVLFAALSALAVAALGLVTGGAVFGSGYHTTRAMVAGSTVMPFAYTLFKLLATWFTVWSGVPAGLFAPSLAIGAALGNDVAQLLAHASAPALIALGMVGFLAAVTQAPLTAFIIVMEMVDGHSMVLSLMASALLASGVARIVSKPLYPALAELQLRRVVRPPTPASVP